MNINLTKIFHHPVSYSVMYRDTVCHRWKFNLPCFEFITGRYDYQRKFEYAKASDVTFTELLGTYVTILTIFLFL